MLNEFNYIKEVLRTESIDFEAIQRRISDIEGIRMLHAALGCCTESAEFADVVKKWLFYDEQPDLNNAAEELGDMCWYIGIALDVLGTTFEEIQRKNIAKLRVRYPEKFIEEDAVNRDTEKEITVYNKEL